MKFRVRNILSWEDSGWIELAPKGQLTVFVGDSHKGKSALVRRSWKKLAYNEPLGLDLLRSGASMYVIDVEDDDGTLISRRQSAGGINEYTMAKPGEIPQKFTGFGSEVPLEIQQALGAIVLHAGDVTIRPGLAEQRDKSFEMSAPSRARLLNVLAGIEPVTIAIDAVRLDEHRAGQTKTRLEAELKRNAEEQAALAWVELFGERLEMLTGLAGRITAADERRTKVHALGSKIAANVSGLLASQRDVDRLAGAHQAVALVAEAAAKAEKSRGLAGLLSRWQANERQTDAALAAIDALDRVGDMVECTATLDAMAARLDRLRALWAKFRNIADQSMAAELILARRESIDAAQARLAVVADVLDRREKVAVLGGRVVRHATDADANRGALVVLENEVDQLKGAHKDALDTLTVECPKCGTQFLPEILKEVA
jgi:exonuclease SbcC